MRQGHVCPSRFHSRSRIALYGACAGVHSLSAQQALAFKCAVTSTIPAPPSALSFGPFWIYPASITSSPGAFCSGSIWLLNLSPLAWGLKNFLLSTCSGLCLTTTSWESGRKVRGGWWETNGGLHSLLPFLTLLSQPASQGSLPRRPETLCLTPRSQCVLTSLVRLSLRRADVAQSFSWIHTLYGGPMGVHLHVRSNRKCFLFYNS